MDIIVVEDDTSFLKYIVSLISSFGYSVDKAETGKVALKKIKKKKFDLALLDIFLPDTMAHNLIPKIKEMHPSIKIVTMTGDNTEELERDIRKLGIIYYMAKPFPVEHLKNILDHISQSL
ncbi:MAG: response regulator [Desulfobacterales bacterium]|nr:response regulator [Desulfobacterales bacterium]